MTDAAITSAKPKRSRRKKTKQHRAGTVPDKRIRQLVTPEGAVLNLRIATAGERAGAFLLDFGIQMISIVLIVLGIVALAAGFGARGWEIAGAVISILVFFIRNFYFIYFELGRKAATPGKRALGLRVAARDGGRLKANAIIARNFMRELEVFLPLQVILGAMFADNQIEGWINLLLVLWCGIFMLFPLFNKDKLRIGDLIAGTMVIHAPKVQLLDDITSAPADAEVVKGYAFTPVQLGIYGIHELHVLEDVLRQSTPEIKRNVANRIAKKIGWTPANGQTDVVFLEMFYANLRKHLEQRMLFGEKKVDKHDRG